jgi:hypothetical protein
MDLVCPKHPNIVLFKSGVIEMFVAGPRYKFCPMCKKNYFEHQCVPRGGAQ